MKTFLLEVITPERLVYRGQAEMLIARGTEGDLGVLAGHAPLLTGLRIGVIRIKGPYPEKVAVAGGFLSVRRDGVSVLADTAERSAEIDVMRARAAKERAEARLRAAGAEVNITRAEAALQRALARLEAAE